MEIRKGKKKKRNRKRLGHLWDYLIGFLVPDYRGF